MGARAYACRGLIRLLAIHPDGATVHHAEHRVIIRGARDLPIANRFLHVNFSGNCDRSGDARDRIGQLRATIVH